MFDRVVLDDKKLLKMHFNDRGHMILEDALFLVS